MACQNEYEGGLIASEWLDCVCCRVDVRFQKINVIACSRLRREGGTTAADLAQ